MSLFKIKVVCNFIITFHNSGDFGNGSMAGGFFNAGTPGGTVNTPGEKKVCKLKKHISISCTFFSCVLLFQGSGAQRAHNIIPVNIPGGCTDALQIADLVLNKVFKVGFKREFFWVMWSACPPSEFELSLQFVYVEILLKNNENKHKEACLGWRI